MKANDRNRLWVAIVLSALAHLTAIVLLLPIYAVARALVALSKKENEGIWVALLLAVLLHVAVIGPAVNWIMSIEPSPTDGDLLNVEIWSRDDALSDAQDEEEEEKPPEEQLEEYDPKEEIPEGQVVQVAPSKDNRPPEEKPRFLAEHDSRVERESQSRIRIPGANQAASRPTMPGKGREAQTLPGGMRAELEGVAPLPSELEQAESAEQSLNRRAPPSLNDINLQPSMEAMTSALAGTGLDHLEDVVEGDHTALNTAGWRYAAFFNRIKRRVEQYWHPDVKYRRHDPYGNIYGFKDRSTVLLVILRGDGSLKKVYVMEPSGATFLDEEAVQAVTKAAPFPNVPPGLKDKRDGLVKFTFHFLVQVGGAPVFRMRKYN